jgi:hypothetical protein
MEKYSFVKWIKSSFLSLCIDNSSGLFVHIFYFNEKQVFPQHHQHFIPIFNEFQNEGKHCVVTSYNIGIPFSQFLSSNQVIFDEESLKRIMYQIWSFKFE